MVGGVVLTLMVLGTLVNGQQVFLTLGSTTITTNNSEILITDIGEDATGGLPSLTCNTDLTTCCRPTDHSGTNALGEWYYPDGTIVPRNPVSQAAGQQFYRLRNDPQVLRLARREGNNPLSPTGSYCCEVPTTGGNMTFCANLVLCGSLTLTNGMISYSDSPLVVGSVATHTCNPGYELSGGSTRTCQSNGMWSGSALACEITVNTCPDLTMPANGGVMYNDGSIGSRPEGTVATYSCNNDYTLSSTGDNMRTCGSNGIWDGSAPTCEASPTDPPMTTSPPVTCSDLTMPDNGMITYDDEPMDSRPEGTVATYMCMEGFIISGDSTRTCEADGDWTASDPSTCERVSCGDPPAVLNGAIMSMTGTTLFEDTATYSCDNGYQLMGEATVTCQTNMTWSTAPTCTAICTDLTLTNGMISYNGDGTMDNRPVGTVAIHGCDTGYELSGGPTRTCEDSGNGNGGVWNGMEITCFSLLDGTIESLDRTPGDLTGRILSFTEVGPGTATHTALRCLVSNTANVEWQDPDGNNVSRGTGPATGNQLITAVNNNIFVALLRGPEHNTKDGQYCCVRTTTNERRCVYLTACPTLNALSEGTVTYNATSDEATTTCNEDYAVSSEMVITCSDTTWSPAQPDCLRICTDLPEPVNGMIIYSPDTTPRLQGTVATHSCYMWYVLMGGSTRTCQNDATWSGEEITCESEVDCGSPPTVINGTVMSTTGTMVGDTVSYSCDTGYELMGEATVTCQADGMWSTVPMCNIIDCDSPPSIDNGSVEVTNTTFEGIATYSCDPGSTLIGSATVTCLSSGNWSSPPDCLILTAVLTLDPSPMAGQSFSLTCTLSGADSLIAVIIYQFVQSNPGMENVVRGTQSTPMFTFDPLVLSDSGQYHCEVTLDITTDVFISSNENLNIQIPIPTVSLTGPDAVFVDDSPQLSCTVTVDSSVVNIPVSVCVQWEGPSGTVDLSTDQLSSGATTLSTTLNTVTTDDSGDYTCTATLSSNSTYVLVNEGSDMTQITIYPAPTAPNVIVTEQTTSLTFSWTQPSDDLVTQYSLTLTYTGDCTDISSTSQTDTVNGSVTEYTFSDREEFSDYQFNITASNRAGSNGGSVTATTLSAAPSGRVENLMASSSTNTSITIQWNRVQCKDRNSEITGYTVTYMPGGTTETITGTDSRQFTASGLIPRADYTFTVSPVSDIGSGPSESLMEQTMPVTDVTLQLDGVFYPDHSLITADGFGEDTAALYCLTPNLDCCTVADTGGPNGAGQWIHPDGTNVLFPGQNPPFNMFRQLSRVSLARQSDFTPPSGIYRCLIPGADGSEETIHIGLYPEGAGAPMITNLTANRAEQRLTCVSTGGPASVVVWTRNGQSVSTGYTLSQTVTSFTEGTYDNILTAQNAEDLNGEFSCTVSNIRGTSAPQVLDIGVRIDSPELTVGQQATLTCEADLEGTIEWLNSSMTVLMTGTGSSLDYTIDVVSDSLNGSILYCRAAGELVSITLSVNVPSNVIMFDITATGSPTAGSEYSLRCEVTAAVSGLVNMPTAMWTFTGDDPQVSTSNGVSTLTFTSLKTLQAGDYTCEGQLVSPALVEPLMTQQVQTVTVTIPTPGVSLRPSVSLIAGTTRDLTCTITVDSAVHVNVMVEVTWEISTGGNNPITSTSTVTGSVPTFTDTLTIPILSTTYTAVICRAVVSPVGSFPNIINSRQGSNELPLTIEVPDLPMVTITANGESVAGSSLSLNCTATPPVTLVNPPTVLWMGLDVSDPDVTVENTQGPVPSVTVTFDPLRTSHGMQYTCVAMYDIPDANLPQEQATNSSTVNVQIPADPQTTLMGSSPIDSGLSTGENVTLTCQVTFDTAVDSDLDVSRSWLKDSESLMMDGSRVTFTEAVRVQVSPQVYQTMVEFRPLNNELGDSGNYSCTFNIEPADPSYITGTTTSVSRDIVVEDFPVQQVTVLAEQTISAGDSYNLECVATRDADVTGTLELEWFGPDGSPVSGGNGITVTGQDSTTSPTISSTLTVSSVNTSLAGPYTCSVNLTIPNIVQDHNVRKASALRVMLPPPQSVMVTASRPAPFEGTTGLVISCEITPDNTGVDSPITVNRDIDGPAVGDSRAIVGDSGGTLTISPLATSDGGVYTCTANVSSDSPYIITSTSTTGTYSLTVTDLPAPEVTITSSTSQPEAGAQDISLTCSVSVVDMLASSPTILWTNSTGHIILEGVPNELTSVLSFGTLRTSDAGRYTCTATIDIPEIVTIDGANMMTLSVTIPAPNVVVSSNPPVHHGTNHTLSCEANYSSNVNTDVDVLFSWSGPNRELMDNENFSISSNPSQSNLTLTPVDQSSLSNGDYSCTVIVQPQDNTAFIIAGSNSDTVSLDVQDPPLPVVMTSVPMREERCGQLTSITCTATVQDNFVSSPVLSWLGPDNQTVSSDGTLIFGSMTPGVYTCQACVTVEKVNIINLCNTSSVNIVNDEPPSVTDLTCRGASSNSLEIQWSPPADQTPLSYQVEVRDYRLSGEQVVTFPVMDNEISSLITTVDGLSPGVRYLVTVMAISGTDCGSEQTIECYTEEQTPPQVTGVTVVRNSGTEMTVSWDPINIVNARGFISFTIIYTPRGGSRKKRQTLQETVPGNESSVVIDGLDPASRYDVTVQAESGGGTSISQSVTAFPQVLFQLRLTNINNCPEWVDQDGRIETVADAFAAAVETHCSCGFSTSLISAHLFRCFPESNTAVTYRARLADSRLLSAIEDWIQESGFIIVQSVLIQVDKSCQVEISSLISDSECISSTLPPPTTPAPTVPTIPGADSTAVIGGVVGVVVVLIIAITVVVVVILVIRSRKDRLNIHKREKRALPPVALRAVTSTGQIEPYEMMEMGHEYEDVSKYQQEGTEYEIVGDKPKKAPQPSSEEYEYISETPKPVGYENLSAVVAASSPNPVDSQDDTHAELATPQPSTDTEAPVTSSPLQEPSAQPHGEYEFTECVAYHPTTHAPPAPNSDDPLYAN